MTAPIGRRPWQESIDLRAATEALALAVDHLTLTRDLVKRRRRTLADLLVAEQGERAARRHWAACHAALERKRQEVFALVSA